MQSSYAFIAYTVLQKDIEWGMQNKQELQLVQWVKAVLLYLVIDFSQTAPNLFWGSTPNTLTNFINCLPSSPATILHFAYK